MKKGKTQVFSKDGANMDVKKTGAKRRVLYGTVGGEKDLRLIVINSLARPYVDVLESTNDGVAILGVSSREKDSH